MRKIILSLSVLLSVLGAGATNPAQPREIRVAIIGDSTVCNYPEESNIRGWGQYLQSYFNEKVEVVNLAESGCSTKTFIAEGLWAKTLQQKANYILIQFGHNDSHTKDRPEATDAAVDYPANLRRYVEDSRKAGAEPIFVSPMHRRTFDKSGKLTLELLPYVTAMKRVAAEQHVPLVDLYTASGELIDGLGDAGSRDLSCRPGDRTHFSPKGATAMAELVVKGLHEADPRLAKNLK